MNTKYNEMGDRSIAEAVSGQTPLRVADPTVGEHLDKQIQGTREKLEQLCILKAKAEASGLLNFPHRFVSEVANAYSPF